MSIFASDSTATVDLPFDAPHTVTIQKLTGRDLERAQAEHLAAFTSGRSPRGWQALFQKAIREGTATPALLEQGQRDPLAGLDRTAVVRGGLTGWSYEKPVSPEAIADIDDEALEFLATEIMRLTKPGLFLTEEEAVAQKKTA